MEYRILELWNPGVLVGKLPPVVFEKLKFNCFNNFATEKFNSNLVGNIKDEFIYPHEKHPEFSEYLIQTYDLWRETFRSENNLEKNQYPHINSVWVNMQKKGEYNPNHNHGGHVSFVTWVQIPYEIEEELKEDYYTNTDFPIRKAAFEFTYSTMNHGVAMHTMHINKHDEGTIIMFPANMLHCVYPFTTTDSVRISVAGNLSIKTHV